MWRRSGSDVRAALALLPERQRLALFLRYYADHELGEELPRRAAHRDGEGGRRDGVGLLDPDLAGPRDRGLTRDLPAGGHARRRRAPLWPGPGRPTVRRLGDDAVELRGGGLVVAIHAAGEDRILAVARALQ